MLHKSVSTLFFLILFNIATIFSFGQELTKKDKEIAQTEAYSILQQYEQIFDEFSQNSGDDAAISGLKDQFIALFLNRQIQVYNDLEPSHSYSEFYEVETYISNFILWYPDGIQVDIDYSTLKTPGISHHNENIWYIDMQTTKRIHGNYMNRNLNDNSEELSFRIAFVKEGNRPDNFRIVGIRSANSSHKLTDEKSLKELNKTEYTEDEEVTVHQSAKSLLMDYNRSLELIGNAKESNENKVYYSYDFISLFESEGSKVVNDITPDESDNLITIKRYIEQYKTNYPEGISNLNINIDSAQFSHIEETSDGKYQTFVYANKFFSGKYKSKEKFTSASPLVFTISMDRSEGVFQNFLIKSIDIVYTDFSGINEQLNTSNKTLTKLNPITRKGNSIGISYMGGISNIQSENINELDLSLNNHSWTTIPQYGYSAGIDFLFFFSNNFGFATGLKYSHFKTTYQLSGQFHNPGVYDINDDQYIDSVVADIDSTVTLNYFSIPAQIKFIHNFNKKYAFYLNIGINISYLNSATYELSGTYDKYGYYTDPSRPEEHRVINFEELGFGSRDYSIPETNKTELKQVNILGDVAVGLNLKTGYYSSLQFGARLLVGLTSINNNTSYSDIFGNTYDAKSIKTNSLGLEISYIRKL